MKKKLSFNNTRIEKTTDLDGRAVEKMVYPGEKKSCRNCKFLYKDDKKYTRCEFYPSKYWRVGQVACVKFK